MPGSSMQTAPGFAGFGAPGAGAAAHAAASRAEASHALAAPQPASSAPEDRSGQDSIPEQGADGSGSRSTATAQMPAEGIALQAASSRASRSWMRSGQRRTTGAAAASEAKSRAPRAIRESRDRVLTRGVSASRCRRGVPDLSEVGRAGGPQRLFGQRARRARRAPAGRALKPCSTAPGFPFPVVGTAGRTRSGGDPCFRRFDFERCTARAPGRSPHSSS